MKNVIKYLIIFILVIIIIISMLVYHYPNEAKYIVKLKFWCWQEWPKLILTTFIGGLLASYIAYLIMIGKENKKDIHRKKEKCTKALLATQMALRLKMEEINSIKKLAGTALNFNLCGKSLRNHFNNISKSDSMALLSSLCEKEKDSYEKLKELMKPVISPTTNIMV